VFLQGYMPYSVQASHTRSMDTACMSYCIEIRVSVLMVQWSRAVFQNRRPSRLKFPHNITAGLSSQNMLGAQPDRCIMQTHCASAQAVHAGLKCHGRMNPSVQGAWLLLLTLKGPAENFMCAAGSRHHAECIDSACNSLGESSSFAFALYLLDAAPASPAQLLHLVLYQAPKTSAMEAWLLVHVSVC